MAVKPSDFLASAQEMVTRGQEIDYRNAASRAYYAAYLRVERHAAELPSPASSTGKGVHAKVIAKFSASDNEDLAALGISLSAMKKTRTAADYKLQDTVSQSDAMKQVEVAKLTLEEADRIFG